MFRLDTRWKRSVKFIGGTCHALGYARVQASLTSLSRASGSCTLAARVCVHISACAALIAEGDRKASTIRSARFSRVFLRSSRLKWNRWDGLEPSGERERDEDSNGRQRVTAEADPQAIPRTPLITDGCSKSRLFPHSRETHAISLFRDALRTWRCRFYKIIPRRI